MIREKKGPLSGPSNADNLIVAATIAAGLVSDAQPDS
jgi:hypothetical protein